MSKREKLQELLNLIEDKILFLRREKVLATDPVTIFSLEKQIEKDEAERNEIQQQMANVEAEACSEDLYNALMKLGYREQVRAFRKFLKTQSIKACRGGAQISSASELMSGNLLGVSKKSPDLFQ